MKGVMFLSVFPLDMGRANSAVCYGDRAVIIVSALVTILSSSSSVSKDNIGTRSAFAETTCTSVHQKLLQLLNGEMSWKENSSLLGLDLAISVDEAHCVSKW